MGHPPSPSVPANTGGDAFSSSKLSSSSSRGHGKRACQAVDDDDDDDDDDDVVMVVLEPDDAAPNGGVANLRTGSKVEVKTERCCRLLVIMLARVRSSRCADVVTG